MPSFISHWYSCFHWWSWSALQNETKRSGDHQVFQQKKKRNDIIFKEKSLNGKSDKLKNLGFMSAKLFISDSMCYENHQLFYRCRQLKRWGLFHLAWFFCICIYVKVGKNSDATKIKHICNIQKALNMENMDSYLGINV